jgi:hypothetical protein
MRNKNPYTIGDLGFVCASFVFARYFCTNMKIPKPLERSALPTDVMWAKAYICASPYSCKKIRRDFSPSCFSNKLFVV